MDKFTLVLGLGISGRAAAELLLKRGIKVIGIDKNAATLVLQEDIQALIKIGLRVASESEHIDILQIDSVVASPGIPPTHPIYQQALQAGKEIIGEVELACRSIKQPVLAITGSNGKTTTTLLVEHVLNQNGFKAKAVGNVGIPLTRALLDTYGFEDILVLELSSWQLETMESKVIDAGAILNITPNHLDRHVTMAAYAAAKIKMKDCLKPNGTLWMGCTCYQEFKQMLGSFPVKTFGYTKGSDIFCDKHDITIENFRIEIPLEYQESVNHHIENMMAAMALCSHIGIRPPDFMAAFASFKKPPHRIEFVRNIRGVSYFDDSKGTNIEAVARAVQSMKGPTILIAGGVHKGTSYASWAKTFAGKVRFICAIGQSASQIQYELKDACEVEIFSDLGAAVEFAASIAQDGENVLLSPGCASFDMFKDYQHRGQEFKRLINAL